MIIQGIVTGTANFQPIATEAGTVDTAALTPDALMTYCETRLGAIDTQVKTAFAQQQKANADGAALTTLGKVLGDVSVGGVHDSHCAIDVLNNYQTAIDKVGADTDLGHKLQVERQSFLQKVDKDGALAGKIARSGNGYVDRNDGCAISDVDGGETGYLKERVDAVKGYQSDLSSNSELTMISLQGLMSQRQTAIQLTTNLVQSLGDQMNKITANVGH